MSGCRRWCRSKGSRGSGRKRCSWSRRKRSCRRRRECSCYGRSKCSCCSRSRGRCRSECGRWRGTRRYSWSCSRSRRGCRGRRGRWRWRSYTVSCAGVKGALVAGTGAIAISAPDNHFTVGRDGSVQISGVGWIDQASCDPTVCNGVVSPAGVKVINRAAVDIAISAPDNHLTAGQDGGVIVSPQGRVGEAGCCPTVCYRVVSPAGVTVAVDAVARSTPHNHLRAAPNSCVIRSSLRRVSRAGCRPAICRGVISPASVQITADIAKSAPDDHPIASPHRGMEVSRFGRVCRARCCPAIGAGIISAAGIKILFGVAIISAPDNHLSAGPDRCMIVPCFGRVSGVGCCPAICSRVVSTAGVRVADHVVKSAPDNHPGASPDGGMLVSRIRRVGGTGWCPTVCSRIVLPTGVKVAAIA